MKLLNYIRREDYGVEHIFSLFQGKNFSLVQFSVGWDDYRSWPYIQVSSGNNSLFDLLFYAYRFSFNIQLIGRTWVHYLDRVGLTDNTDKDEC